MRSPVGKVQDSVPIGTVVKEVLKGIVSTTGKFHGGRTDRWDGNSRVIGRIDNSLESLVRES